MITLCALALGLLVGGGWGLLRRFGLGQEDESQAESTPRYFPKLEAIWLGCIVFSVCIFSGQRFFGNPDAQVLDVQDLWVVSFPFLIMSTILLYFSLKMTRSQFFRPRGMRAKAWKFLVFPPLGALLITIPAVDVLNRSTDLSPLQPFEVVVQDLGGKSWFHPDGACTVIAKSPLQDGEFWTIRLQSSMCSKVRVGITPLRLSLRDGRFGLPYVDKIEITEP